MDTKEIIEKVIKYFDCEVTGTFKYSKFKG